VDWSQTRVAFVSPSFTENQIQATNFKDIAIELWEVKQYENDSIFIKPIKKTNSAESIKPLTQNKESLKKVTEEIKVYTEEDVLNKGSDEMKELYVKFKNSIMNLHYDIAVQPKKDYIAYKLSKNIVDITVLKNSIKLWINLKKGRLDDPKKIARDVSRVGHWGNGDYEISIKDDHELEYILSLIKQAIK
jgi:predicted transport protein